MRGIRLKTVLSVLVLSGSVTSPSWGYAGGSGTPQDPYRIADAKDLIQLGTTPSDQDKQFLLVAYIDLAGKTWPGAVIPKFSGTFDGNDLTIRNLRIEGPSLLGLFGQLEKGSRVKNLGILNVGIDGDHVDVGALAACNHGSVARCHSSGVLNAGRGQLQGGIAGGLIGINHGTVSNCFSRCKVSGTSCVGGLVAYNSGTVNRCYSAGTVDFRLSDGSGLVGENAGNVAESFYDLSGISDSGVFFNRSDLLPTAGARCMSTVQMKEIKTYLDAGWDFVGESKNGTEDIWTMGEDGYPCFHTKKTKHGMNSDTADHRPSGEDTEALQKWVDINLAVGLSQYLAQAPGHYQVSERLKNLVAASQVTSTILSNKVWITILNGGVSAKVDKEWVVPFAVEGGNVPKLEFRNGKVGLLKGETYIEGGTEVRVGNRVWIYRQGTWHQQMESTTEVSPTPSPVSSQRPDMEGQGATAIAEGATWNNAAKQDAVEGYESFLATYPNSVYAAEAKMRMKEIKNNDPERLAEVKSIGDDLAALLQFIQKYPTGTKKSAAILARQRFEDLVIESIRKVGPGDRFVIKEIMPVAGESIGSCTVERLDKGAVALCFDYPKDCAPVDTRRGGLAMLPAGPGSVIRFRGTYGDFLGYKIEGDAKEPLAFVLLDKMGMVYVAGRGKVNLKNGTVVTIPAIASSESLQQQGHK